MLVIALDQQDGFPLPFNQAANWYGVSESTARRGLRGLEARDLLSKTRREPEGTVGNGIAPGRSRPRYEAQHHGACERGFAGSRSCSGSRRVHLCPTFGLDLSGGDIEGGVTHVVLPRRARIRPMPSTSGSAPYVSAMSGKIVWCPRRNRSAGSEDSSRVAHAPSFPWWPPRCSLSRMIRLASLMSGAEQEAALGQAEVSIFSTRSRLGLLLD